MTNLTRTIPELVRLWEHDRDIFIEVINKPPYNNAGILKETVELCIAEISQKNQQIQYVKRDLKEAYSDALKIASSNLAK